MSPRARSIILSLGTKVEILSTSKVAGKVGYFDHIFRTYVLQILLAGRGSTGHILL